MPKKTGATKASIAAGHETADINARGLAWNAAALAIGIAATFFASTGLFHAFSARYPAVETPARDRATPPDPRLQVDEARDLARLRQHEDSLLGSYGWVNQTAGIARIPIERAMSILAQRGLPTPPAGAGKTRLEMRQERANSEKAAP